MNADQAWCLVASDGTRDYVRVVERSGVDGVFVAHHLPIGGFGRGTAALYAVMELGLLFGLGNYRFLGPGVAFDRDGEPLCGRCDGSGFDPEHGHPEHGPDACCECLGMGVPRVNDPAEYNWSGR